MSNPIIIYPAGTYTDEQACKASYDYCLRIILDHVTPHEANPGTPIVRRDLLSSLISLDYRLADGTHENFCKIMF